MSDPQPDTEQWHASSQIRVALAVVFVPLLIRIAQHTQAGPWLASHLGVDLLTFKAEDIVNWLMLALSAIGSVFWIRKRVKAGKDPASNAPEIIPPKIVQRLTGSTPIVRDDPSADFAASLEEVAPEKKSEDQLLADYRARMKRQNGPPAAPVGGPAAKDAGGGA